MKLILFDTNGFAAWSTDLANLDISKPKPKGSRYWNAVEGEIASKFVSDKEIIDLDGVQRSLDIVETYMPLTDTSSGQVIGVLEFYRNVAGDVAFQVNDAKSSVLRTTVGTMGGLSLVLVGFIIVAEVTINQSRRRELALVEAQLDERARRRISDARATKQSKPIVLSRTSFLE